MRQEKRRRKEEQFTIIDWALTLAIILLFLAIGAMIGYAWHAYRVTPEPVRRVVIQPAGAEKRWIQQRHKYHNVWISVEEPGSKPYFYRDGKKCKL
jgi:hypothetical protein